MKGKSRKNRLKLPSNEGDLCHRCIGGNQVSDLHYVWTTTTVQNPNKVLGKHAVKISRLDSDQGLGSNFIQRSKNREDVNSKLRKARVKEQKMTSVE